MVKVILGFMSDMISWIIADDEEVDEACEKMWKDGWDTIVLDAEDVKAICEELKERES